MQEKVAMVALKFGRINLRSDEDSVGFEERRGDAGIIGFQCPFPALSKFEKEKKI